MASRKRLPLLLMTLTLLLFGAACAGGNDSGGGDGGAAVLAPEEAPAEGMDEAAGDGDGGGLDYAQGDSATTLPDIGPAVIKTAKVKIEVEDGSFQGSVQEAIAIAERHGGFVLESQVGGIDEGTGSVVLRIPAEQFESALGELKDLAVDGGVESERVSGQDVSQEFVDLQSRLRNYEAQETVLLGLMEKAATVSDSIRVQRELTNVQLEIEQLRGRLNFLKDQTQFSTITLGMREAGAAEPKPTGTIAKAWDQAKETFGAVVSAVIISTGFIVPVALLALIALLAVRLLRPVIARAR